MRRAAWDRDEAAATVATRRTRWSGLKSSHAIASSFWSPGAASWADDASSAPTRRPCKETHACRRGLAGSRKRLERAQRRREEDEDERTDTREGGGSGGGVASPAAWAEAGAATMATRDVSIWGIFFRLCLGAWLQVDFEMRETVIQTRL
jgi:hypothetical protein